MNGTSISSLTVFAWQVGFGSSFAAGPEPPRPDAGRPLAAAVATAGPTYRHLLSQVGATPISGNRKLLTALGAGVGFGIGYGAYYFKNKPLDHPDEKAHALASGTFVAVIGGLIVYWW